MKFTRRTLQSAAALTLLGAMGAPWVFLLNCFCYGGLIWAIWRWKRDLPVRRLPPEGILEGVVAALRYTQHSTVTRVVMLRSFAFGLSARSLNSRSARVSRVRAPGVTRGGAAD